jgi:cell shape-determining protein MreD
MYFLTAGIACIVALALWKATKERWVPSLLGMIVLAWAIKLAKEFESVDTFILGLGVAIIWAGVYGLKRYDARQARPRV